VSESAIRVTSELGSAGYRNALLALSLLRLRFVLPIVAFFAFARLASGDMQQALLLFGSLIGIFIIVWLWVTWQAYSPSNQSVRKPVEYVFTPERIEFFSEDADGFVEWESFKRWRYISRHYFLHHSSASFLAIPGACVAEEDLDALEALFHEQIPKGPRGPVR
jgi:hypothetical protein